LKCIALHKKEFVKWRQQIRELQQIGMQDLNSGYHYPYLQNRSINDLQEINYHLKWKNTETWAFTKDIAVAMFDHYQYLGIKRSDLTGEKSTGNTIKKKKLTNLN